MKKIIGIVVLVLLAATMYAQNIEFGVGGSAGLMLDFNTMSIDDIDTSISINHTMLFFGVCLDATFVRLGIDYALNVAQSGKLEYGSTEIDAEFEDGYSISFLSISLLGKYPIDLGGVIIWPAAGIRYALCLAYDIDGDGEDDLTDDDALNDLFALIGVGADITAGPVVVSPSLIFGYNLTSNPTTEDLPDDVSILNFNIQFGVSVIYKL